MSFEEILGVAADKAVKTVALLGNEPSSEESSLLRHTSRSIL